MSQATAGFLNGGGNTGALIRAHDWAGSELGSPERWPEALQNAVRTILGSDQPMRVTWGPSQILIYNEAYAAILGDRHPAALGMQIGSIWPEVLGRLEQVMQQVQTGESMHKDDLGLTLLRHGREEKVRLAFSWIPLKSGAQEVAGVLCVCREVNDKELQRARELQRLRELFEQSPSFIAVLDGPEHVFVFTNPAYLKLIGKQDVVGMTVRSVLPEVEAQGFLDLLDGVYRNGETFVGRAVEVSLQRAPGEPAQTRYLDFTYQALRNTSGQITGVFVDGVDVTATKQALDIVKTSEETFRTFAQVMPNQVWAALPNGDLDWFNDQALKYSGHDFDYLAGTGWARIIHPEDLSRAQEAWLHCLATGEPYQIEFRIRRFDGTYRWHLARALPIRDDNQRITRWVGTNTDVEDQRVARENLQAINSTLEQRVEERTREREDLEEQLRHSQKMESLGQLTGGIAHDFNNMLAVILGSIDLTKRQAAVGNFSEVSRLMERAEGSIRRASSLTQRLLAFARRQPLSIERVDVAALLHAIQDMVVRTIGKGITLQLSVLAELWAVKTDASQLDNALLNLVINARDAMPQGGKLTIEAINGDLDAHYAARHPEVTAGDYVVIRISDNGSGMPPDVLAKAFDPFFTTKPVGQGTGLGLSMVFGFMKQTGGHIHLHSAPTLGTTVTLYLPRDLSTPSQVAVESGIQSPARSDGEVILLVEDNEDLRELQAEILRELGYECVVAEDAEAALRILESEQAVHLLLTDVGLPGMNGRQLAEIARKHRPDLPVVFLTGFAGEPSPNGALAPNMFMLTKPVDVEALASRLREILSQHHG